MTRSGTIRMVVGTLAMGGAAALLAFGCSGASTNDPAEAASSDVVLCRHVEEIATLNYNPGSVKDAQQTFSPALKIVIPRSLPVTVGNGGSGGATLAFDRLPEKKPVRCHYSAGAGDMHPTDPAAVLRGKQYVADWCDFNAKPGDTITTDFLKLHIESGDCNDPAKKTQVSLKIDEATCPKPDAGTSTTDLVQCTDRVHPRSDLSGPAQELAYQADLARTCTMVGVPDCMVSLVARANVDYFAAATRMISGAISPAQYLALSRDRARKLRAAQGDTALAMGLCSKPDSDGDFVPDDRDACPGTPDLVATDDRGCPLQSLPTAPNADDVKRAISSTGVIINPRCNGAVVPDVVSAGAFYWQHDVGFPGGQDRSYILSGRVHDQPVGCPTWYEFDIEETSGPRAGYMYTVVFMDREETLNVLGNTSYRVRPEFIQFSPGPSDSGTRGILRDAATRRAQLRFRVRAMNGNGVRGPWSTWKTPETQDFWWTFAQ